ncbi:MULTISPECIES: site-2 protease family protein [unclassified Burkholderia]|uniref:site-2 protease family protein n=1 Tax=unclassified Burkholderia TaxID=2613784 RepID=UPI002AB1E27E|nr:MULTISPECIES: site-2 protease family protein [unclassified Burkholderia]
MPRSICDSHSYRIEMTKIDILVSVLSVVLLIAAAWFANWKGFYPAWKAARLAVSFYFISYIEAVIHEGGHVFAGMWFGAPVDKVRFGVGRTVRNFSIARISQEPITFCLLPLGGRVDFAHLPISRTERIWMYAAGMVAVMIAATIAWIFIPSTYGWLRIEAVLVFCGHSALNAFYSTSQKVCDEEGVFSDGQAIRGLLRYS